MFDKDTIDLWKKEIYDKSHLIDPENEWHWESLAIGWCIAKGMNYDDSIEFGRHYHELSN